VRGPPQGGWPRGVAAKLARACVVAVEAEARKGNAPGRINPKRARDAACRRNLATVSPNRQRDQTPEAKPLWQQCPCAVCAEAPRSERDKPSGLSDEQVFGTANFGGRG